VARERCARRPLGPEWRFYFRLRIQAFEDLSVAIQMCGLVVQSLLVMVVRNGAINGAKARDRGPGEGEREASRGECWGQGRLWSSIGRWPAKTSRRLSSRPWCRGSEEVVVFDGFFDAGKSGFEEAG